MKSEFKIFGSCFLVLSFVGCGNEEKSKATPIELPEIAPIVLEATPAGLKPSAQFLLKPATNLQDSATSAASYIEALFKNTYNGISGTSAQGYINTQIKDLDSRLDEMSRRSSESEAGRQCWLETPQDHTVDASSINPVLTVDMQVNCKDAFGSEDESGIGSGLVFGKNAASTDFYAWLTLYQSNGTDVFGYLGGVKNAEDPAQREVDYMFLENFPQYGRVSASRLYAKPASNTFELHYASQEADLGAGPGATDSAKVGCGFRMISDGSSIYAIGVISTGMDCTATSDFEICLDATTLEAKDSTTCGIGAAGGLDESFRFRIGSNPLDYADVAASTSPAAVISALTISNVDDKTIDFNVDAVVAE